MSLYRGSWLDYIMGNVFHGNGLLFLITVKSTQNTVHPSRGVARIFQRGGHSRDTIRGSPTIYGLYRCSPSCISGLSRIIAAWRPILTKDKSRWRKYFTKKQILKKWAFQQWLLQPRHCHGIFTTWKGLPRGGHGHPRTPPSYAPASLTPVVYFKHLCSC